MRGEALIDINKLNLIPESPPLFYNGTKFLTFFYRQS